MQKPYRGLLKSLISNIELMDNTSFVNMMFALGKIHKQERGEVVYPRIFKIIKEKVKEKLSLVI